MKYLALLAVLVPAIALAQDSETNCYTYGAGSTQCRTTERRTPQVVAPDIAGAFEQGRRNALARQALEQQAALAATERQNLELQNQLLQRQLDQQKQAISAEAAVVRLALVAFVEEQAKLPEPKRMQDTAEIGKRIAEIAHQMLGYDPSVEAFQLAVRQLQSSQKEE